jgi:hypothetical protein
MAELVPSFSSLPSPSTSSSVADDDGDTIMQREGTEGSEQRRQRQAREFFDQVRSALEEYSSLRAHMEQAGFSINELGNRLVSDEQQLQEELERQRDVTEGVMLEAKVGKEHAASLEERLGHFQRSLHEAERLRDHDVSQIAIEQVRINTRMLSLEQTLAPLPEAVQSISAMQRQNLKTLGSSTQMMLQLGKQLQQLQQQLNRGQLAIEEKKNARVEEEVREAVGRLKAIREKPETVSGDSRRRQRQATVEAVPESPTPGRAQTQSPPPTLSPFLLTERRRRPTIRKAPAVMTGAIDNLDELRSKLKEITKERDFFQEALTGGGAPPTKPPVYTRGGAPEPGDSGSEGEDDRPRRRRAPHDRPQGREPRDPIPSTPQPAPAISPLKKDAPIHEPNQFRMKPDEDYRPFLEQCRDYLFMKRNRFTSDKERVIWALSFMEGEKALTWKSEYRKRLWSTDGDYWCNWDTFEEALIEHCRNPFEEQKAVRQMYDWRYTGDIEAYITKLKYFNHKAKLTGGALRDAVMRGLGESVIKAFSQMGRASTDDELWRKLEEAGQGIEDAVRETKYQSQGGLGGGSKRDGKKRSRTEQEDSPGKKQRTEQQAGKSSDHIIRAGQSDWSKKHDGIPRSLHDRRRKEKKCTRCEGDHYWKDCKANKPVVSSLKKTEKQASKEKGQEKTSGKAQTATMSVPVPKVSAVKSARIMEVDSDEESNYD